MMRTAFLSLAFASLLGGGALAQDVIVEHYDDDTGVVVTAPADARRQRWSKRMMARSSWRSMSPATSRPCTAGSRCGQRTAAPSSIGTAKAASTRATTRRPLIEAMIQAPNEPF